jgi:purine-binding chemotaxis protein CheW
MNTNQTSDAYLTFSLGEENFAIPVEHVQEVVELDQVTRVPNAPEYMLGIINLRGRVLPLFDTKHKLGLPKTETTKKSRIMILNIKYDDNKYLEIGALVDVAKEVVEISASEIQDAPEFENSASSTITGIVNKQGSITMIMDIQRVFTLQEINQLTNN